MKKIKVLLIFLIFTILLVGCDINNLPTDIVPPTISGTSDVTYYIGDDQPDFLDGILAADIVDGDVTAYITYDVTGVDFTTPGVYTVTYSVSDSANNRISTSISVSVLERLAVVDLIPPVFGGLNDITFTIGDDQPNFLDGITAIDAVDGNVTMYITYDTTTVDFTIPGVYTVTYTASDGSGNLISTTISITVLDSQSLEDETPPIIIGASQLNYSIGDTLPDLLAGLSASDIVDGVLTNQITVDDSLVNYDTIGVYAITYSVSDAAGNISSITINIIVQDESIISDIDHLNIYYLNDFHGAIFEDGSQMGLSKIGNLILDEKAYHPENTLFIGGGDFLQGTLISNYFDGASTIDVLNQMQMDAFTIGNHEFDWGFDIITNFREPSSDSIQADFPLLGANIFYDDDTQTRPDNIDAYTIIEKGNLRIGIIGVIGSGLESSIATSKVTGYYFDDPVYWTAYYAEQLRTIENVDVVLAVIHDNGISSGYNQQMSSLTGDQRIDAVFNGHSHSTYAQYITRTGVRLPYIQSGSSGTNLGKVTLEFDTLKNVTQAYAENLTSSSDSRLNTNNLSIDAVIETYYSQVEPLLTEVIIKSGAYMSTTALTYYMAELIRMASDSDIGFHNSGGTRSSIGYDQDITLGTLYQIFPFDNVVKTTYLTGAQIKAFMNSSYGSYFSTRVNNMVFEDNVYYKAATNDYVFDSTSNPFVTGINSEDTGILIRDVLEQVMRNQAEIYDYFLLTNPVVLSALPNLEFVLFIDKQHQLSI